MKVSSGELLNRVIQHIAGTENTVPGRHGTASSPFTELLDAVKDKDRPVTTVQLDREKLTVLLELMKTQMNYAIMNTLSGADDEGSVSTGFEWMNRIPDIKVPQQGESKIGRTAPVDRQAVPREDIGAIIEKASLKFGVDRTLIESVIRAESGFDANATSPKGAMGLMQLMPATAQELGVKNPYDPEENVMAGTRYLKTLLDRYHGNAPLALAAYNWGMGNLERSSGNLPEETRNYIAKIMKNYVNTSG
jgi:hypothetical protein